MSKVDLEVTYGEIQSSVLETFYTLLTQVLTPAIACQDWGKCVEEDKTEFTAQLERFR